MTRAVPPIYTPRLGSTKLDIPARLASAAIALGCSIVLFIAASLQPNSAGVGTHTELGFARCQFLYRTGLPCPSCGMTTSFAYFAHGRFLASIYVQPMGAALALLTAAAFWVSLYIAATGVPAHRLLRLIPTRYYLLPLLLLAVAAWGWKIAIHLRGADGWR